MQVTDRQCKTRRHLVMMIGAYIRTQKQIKGGFVRFYSQKGVFTFDLRVELFFHLKIHPLKALNAELA